MSQAGPPVTPVPAAQAANLPGAVLGAVVGLWTYPLKSLRAVAHARVRVESEGLAGDRTSAFHVTTPGHARSGKTYRGKENAKLHLTHDARTAQRIAAERGVEVALRSGERFFDAAPVSIVFDLWLGDAEALIGEALDPLRYRPNLLVRAAPGMLAREADIVGSTLAIDFVVLRVIATIKRCVTPSYDIATGAATPAVQRAVAEHRGNVMGVYCEVLTPGVLAIGDAVRVR